jgi:hypothetical protein
LSHIGLDKALAFASRPRGVGILLRSRSEPTKCFPRGESGKFRPESITQPAARTDESASAQLAWKGRTPERSTYGRVRRIENKGIATKRRKKLKKDSFLAPLVPFCGW